MKTARLASLEVLHGEPLHSPHCPCAICWSRKTELAQELIVPPRFVHRKSVGDSFGVWVWLIATVAATLFFAYKFWEGMSQ